MPKGFFSQTVCLLLSRPVSLDELDPLLADFEVVKRTETSDTPEIAGPGMSISYRREVNGLVVVDLQTVRWPDHMGDPKKEPMLFAGWSMGHFGPFAFPGNLERAAQQAWTWKEAGAAVQQHQAFLRIKTTYIGGPNDLVLPADYQAEPELEFVVRVSAALARHPAVLAYFNPGGEVLLPPAGLFERLAHAREHHLPSLDVWSNVRMFNPNNGWLLMDTIGMEQLDIPDHEACFPKDGYDPNDVGNMLRNVCVYRMRKGDVLKSGNTMDGPGGIRWRVFHVAESLAQRPRPVLRWIPQDGSNPPADMQPPLPPEEEKPPVPREGKKPGFFSRMKGLLGRD